MSTVDINRKLKSEGLDIDVSNVHQRLLSTGLKDCRPTKKQFITKAMRKKHLQWARKHAKWTTKDRKRVTVSDESPIFVLGQKVPYVRKRKTDKATAGHIQQNVKHPIKKYFRHVLVVMGQENTFQYRE